MSLRRRLFLYVAPLVMVAIAITAALWIWVTPPQSSALWRIVSQQCLPNQLAHNNPAPCAQVDTQAGFVVFKDRSGPLQYLLIALARDAKLQVTAVTELYGVSFMCVCVYVGGGARASVWECLRAGLGGAVIISSSVCSALVLSGKNVC